jgi:hypothetical protein
MIPLAAALALLAGAAPVAGVEPRIALVDGVFVVRPAADQATLEVFVDGPAGLPPLLGEASREGDSVRFKPRYAPQPGLRYRVVYREPGRAAITERLQAPAAPARPLTRLERIDPSLEVVPENLLRVYLVFTAPMSRGEAYRRIRLLDGRGETVDLPFLEIDEELWDRDLRRLTLLFDPGRVKRGLLPHEEVGTPLRAGGTYTLVVDRQWPDAQGNPLASEGRRTFGVGPPDHDPPRTASWRLAPPRAGTREPLVVTFPEPLDRALLERVLAVRGPSGAAIPGEVAVAPGETRWSFTPGEPWRAGGYALRADTILEDLAGNSLGRPFEVDLTARAESRAPEVSETLPFRIE